VDTFGADLLMTSSFGLNGVALIQMLSAITRKIPIVFIDTGYLFPETLETKRRIVKEYGVQVLTYRPGSNGRELPHPWGVTSPNPSAFPNGQGSILTCIRDADRCCAARKVEPMNRAMAELQPAAVVNARSRFQASTRKDLEVVEWDQTPIRINPLALWSQQQIEDYVRAHEIPYNPLFDRGYSSVGCWPCTRAVIEGEHARAGRWAGLAKVECGLWTQGDKPCWTF
jgi:phosphoadenosine phosphosulfate reductase